MASSARRSWKATLITTLLDPDAAQPLGLYQARWEIETALGSLKTQLKGAGIVLRSKTPDGVIQEVWALLCAYHAVRELISAAAAMARQDPLRICFVNALERRPRPGRDPGLFFPLAGLTGSAGPHWPSSPPSPPGPGRTVEPPPAKRSTRYPAKPADPAQRPEPRTKPLMLVMLPLKAQAAELS